MTSDTARVAVCRMIEPRIETQQRWKRFDLSALRVCVTNSANLTCPICELLRVTTRARRMRSFAGQRWLRRVVFTTMAQQTREPRMIAVVVFEL